MQEFKPLPMKDMANPAPMHPAFEKTSQWMNSFMPTVMDKIRAGSVAPTNLGAGNQGGAGIANMLFQAVHPDTFNRVLDFLKPSKSRQEGGPVEPGEEYTVGEAGPEKFKPAVPGQILPYGKEPSPLGSVPGQITYAGMTDRRESPEMPGIGPQAYRALKGSLVSPYESPYEPGLPSFRMPGGEPTPIGGGATPMGATIPPGERAPAYTGRNRPVGGPPAPEGPAPLGEGWQHYGEGIDYKMGPENARGDEMARQRILREATPDLRLPFRSYYEAHPEEKAAQDYYDMMRGPAPSSYEAGVERMKEMNLMDIVKSPNTTPEARKAATEQLTAMKAGKAERETTAMKGAGDIYGKALEYGPTSPLTQERLAKAGYERAEAEAKMANIPLDRYLKTAEATKHLGEAAKADFISGKWGVYHVSSGTFSAPPEGQDKTSLTMIQNLEKEASALSGGDTNLSRKILRDKVKTYLDMGLLKKQDIPPQFFKMIKSEFSDALKKAGKVPRNQEELDTAYTNYVKIPIEG